MKKLDGKAPLNADFPIFSLEAFLKNRILVQGQGGREVPTGGILKVF